MTILTTRQVIKVLPLMAVLVWLTMTSIVSAQERRATLEVSASESTQAGTAMEIVATLTELDGTPIAGEVIDFALSVEFMSNSGEIHIGSATTDASGIARLEYIPKAEGDHYLTASSSENSEVSAFSEMEMTVTSGPQLYRELSPIRVPGANVWMTSAVLIAVWSVFVLIALRIWQISRIGEREEGNSDA
ncbi:MAG: hypothetical protein HQ477_10140 [Chloroflexi bacterium]|nr:hypothetical protein [Chloroflexota bacterium]